MGNAVISGILFQPPFPPNDLDYLGPADHNGGGCCGRDFIDTRNQGQTTNKLAKRRVHNISVNYIWLYSVDDDDSNLIPAIHITHNDKGPGNTNASRAKKYTLLYSHGNAEDLGLISSFLADLARLLQVDILCYDYSGYGVSTDEASVAEFFKGFGSEVIDWKAWRINGEGRVGSGRSPIDLQSRGGRWGMATSKYGRICRYSRELFVAPMIHPRADLRGTEGEYDGRGDMSDVEGDASFAFTDRCSWTQHDDDNESLIKNGIINDPDKLRRRILSQHSWTMPTPSETNCYANIRSAYNYLTTVENVLPQHVILYGKSVGSGPTCWLTQRLCHNEDDANVRCCYTDGMCNIDEAREPTEGNERSESALREVPQTTGSWQAPGGVCLHSPFLSVVRVVLDVGFTTLGDLFPNVDRVGGFTCPVYVIHGSNDGIVPFYHGQTLFQSLPNSSKTVPFWARGAGHNNIELDMPTAYIKRLQQFIRQCDKLNYPNLMSNRKMQQQQQLQQQQQQLASLQASLQQSVALQQQGRNDVQHQLSGNTTRPGLVRYASQDSYHIMSKAQVTKQRKQKPLSESKQRKQKGTLVMRGVVPPPPPPPMRPSPSSPTMMKRHQSLKPQQHAMSDKQAIQYHRSMSTGGGVSIEYEDDRNNSLAYATKRTSLWSGI